MLPSYWALLSLQVAVTHLVVWMVPAWPRPWRCLSSLSFLARPPLLLESGFQCGRQNRLWRRRGETGWRQEQQGRGNAGPDHRRPIQPAWPPVHHPTRELNEAIPHARLSILASVSHRSNTGTSVAAGAGGILMVDRHMFHLALGKVTYCTLLFAPKVT